MNSPESVLSSKLIITAGNLNCSYKMQQLICRVLLILINTIFDHHVSGNSSTRTKIREVLFCFVLKESLWSFVFVFVFGGGWGLIHISLSLHSCNLKAQTLAAIAPITWKFKCLRSLIEASIIMTELCIWVTPACIRSLAYSLNVYWAQLNWQNYSRRKMPHSCPGRVQSRLAETWSTWRRVEASM